MEFAFWVFCTSPWNERKIREINSRDTNKLHFHVEKERTRDQKCNWDRTNTIPMIKFRDNKVKRKRMKIHTEQRRTKWMCEPSVWACTMINGRHSCEQFSVASNETEWNEMKRKTCESTFALDFSAARRVMEKNLYWSTQNRIHTNAEFSSNTNRTNTNCMWKTNHRKSIRHKHWNWQHTASSLWLMTTRNEKLNTIWIYYTNMYDDG